ncbi:MAG: hypothetical protein QW165_04790 [Candidatus Woesearchaeota archaeon]
MGTDFSGFKNFTPQRRIAELRKLISMLKKEIESRQEDIKTAEQLLEFAEEETRVLEQVEVPETPPLRKTQEIEERIEEKTERGRMTRDERTELEQLLATAPPRSPELLHRVAHIPVAQLYNEEKRIYERQKKTGIETQQDREIIYAIRKGLEIKKEEGYKPPTMRERHLMTAAEQMAESMYQTAGRTYKTNPT